MAARITKWRSYFEGLVTLQQKKVRDIELQLATAHGELAGMQKSLQLKLEAPHGE